MGMVQYNHIGEFNIGAVCKNMTTLPGNPYNRLRKLVSLFLVLTGTYIWFTWVIQERIPVGCVLPVSVTITRRHISIGGGRGVNLAYPSRYTPPRVPPRRDLVPGRHLWKPYLPQLRWQAVIIWYLIKPDICQWFMLNWPGNWSEMPCCNRQILYPICTGPRKRTTWYSLKNWE